MTCRLELYLKSAYFISEEIEIPGYEGIEMTEQEHLLREEDIKSAAQKLRIRYLRQIIKCEYDYHVVAVFQSKMNFKSLLETGEEE